MIAASHPVNKQVVAPRAANNKLFKLKPKRATANAAILNTIPIHAWIAAVRRVKMPSRNKPQRVPPNKPIRPKKKVHNDCMSCPAITVAVIVPTMPRINVNARAIFRK